MPSMTPQIPNLRLDTTGLRGAFEEFCCQLFRRAPEIPNNSQYRRVRGDGGDGGVEALWTLPAAEVWGLQAKFFDTLGASQKTNLTESVRQAAANYPSLAHYTICLPFNLTAKTGAKAGRPKRGQHEKISEWIAEWSSELAAQGRSVQFEIWDESELLGRLAAVDTTGGLARYWFDQEALTAAWFAERLAEAKAQAGSRYSPELTVATPLGEALQAFGRSGLWAKRIEQLTSKYAEKLDWWRKTTEAMTKPLSLPEELIGEARAVAEAAEPLNQHLSGAIEDPRLLILPAFQDAVRLSLSRGVGLEPKIKQALITAHGENADSPGFRQWRAEYMADFPMAPLDHLRELLAILGEIEVLAFQPEGRLPAATGMLVRGEAGIGKTHGILDASLKRQASGIPSLVLFGDDVSDDDPWQSLIKKTGLETRLGRDAFLDALNAAAEATGFPLVIFIDALNETQPDRRRWQSWLPPMLEQVKRRPFLKLCVTCREIYVREVIPPTLDIPVIEHNGFLGREYEALFTFFRHYALGVPGEPLLHDEFANPLFLRLVCEALRETRAQAIPVGREGIRAIINLLLRAKNDRAAIAFDYDRRENRVSEAMLRLAGAMASAGSRTLPLADARSLVDGPADTRSQSLFAVLESESLVSIVEKLPLGLGAEPSYSVRFTFERISDHLIAEHLLAGVIDLPTAFSFGGAFHFLAASDEAAKTNAGLLEALSIQLPEKYGTELIDVVQNIDQALLWKTFIASIQWRNPLFVTDRTVQLVYTGLSSKETFVAMSEAVLGCAVRPDHPLNARFLASILNGMPLLARDPLWAHCLEESYSAWSDTIRPKSGVHRLIEAARRGNLDNLPYEVGTLWATILAWFCASPDRRIRDRATMAMVSVFRARPGCITPMLQFLHSDDEYISERVLVAAYGALLLLNAATPELGDAATFVYQMYFAEGVPPLNASLRDHGRLIIELSVEMDVAPDGVDAGLFRPPYNSVWPIALPSEDDIGSYAADRKRFPQLDLVQMIGLATGTDFARYVVEPCVANAFDLKKCSLDKLGIFRWFQKKAVEFGYPGPRDQCASFDRILLSTFGGGRGRPGWAERLGKKYYWIFLRQLVGQLADHADRKSWSKTLPPSADLQGLDLRDLDPTDVRQFLPAPEGDHAWLTPAPYVFRGRDIPVGDAGWVSENDLTDISHVLMLTDSDSRVWQVLDLSHSWDGKRKEISRNRSYRHVSRSVRAATCDAADIQRVTQAFAEAPLDHFNHGPHDYRGYLGEYPRRWPYAHRSEESITFRGKDSGVAFHYLALSQLRGREWERDYSHVSGTKTLLMPSTALVQAGNLQWDCCGSWRDSSHQVQIQDPWWWSDKPAALICRADYMDRFLKENDLALIILGFQMKFIAGGMNDGGRLTERSLFIRNHAKTKLVKRYLVPE